MTSQIALNRVLLALCLCVVSSNSKIVNHGDSLTISNVNDQTYLTATEHSFRAQYGVYVGRVLAEVEFYGTPNQVWDAIRFPGSPENQFWLYPKGGTLNEITAIHLTDYPIPPKNMVDFIYVPNTNLTEQFLIRSVELKKCVESKGQNFRISYETCDVHNLAQQWKADNKYEEDSKGRSKTKFSCKFYG